VNALVRQSLGQHSQFSASEKIAIKQALDAGAQYGYGNVMAWLATEWACKLRDEWNFPEEAAIEAVSKRGPYPLPANVKGDS